MGKAVLSFFTGIMVIISAGIVWFLDVTSTDLVIGTVLETAVASFPPRTPWPYVVQLSLSLLQFVYLHGWMVQQRSNNVGFMATIINVALSLWGVVVYFSTLTWYDFAFIPWDLVRWVVQSAIALVLACLLAFSPELLVTVAIDLFTTTFQTFQERWFTKPTWMERLGQWAAPRSASHQVEPRSASHQAAARNGSQDGYDPVPAFHRANGTGHLPR